VGTALAVLLERAGHRVVAATGREPSRERVRRHLAFTPFLPWAQIHEATAVARIVLISLPDDRIADGCADLAARRAFQKGQLVLHSAGSLSLKALEPARLFGAEVLSLHPLQSVPDVETGIGAIPGSWMAVTAWGEEGYEAGEALAGDVRARPFRIADDAKPLYHAAAVFASNYLVTVEGVAEALFRAAGVSEPLERFWPLARASLDAAFRAGPAEALTGPAVRGDLGTIQRNLTALADVAPDVLPAYLALAAASADMAVQAGRLSEQRRARLQEVFDRWR
jgi:predicted short-subunit dehydrogenase-like oxidoreductase (DUF2520 family)